MMTKIKAELAGREVELRLWGGFPLTGWPYKLPKLPSITKMAISSRIIPEPVRVVDNSAHKGLRLFALVLAQFPNRRGDDKKQSRPYKGEYILYKGLLVLHWFWHKL